jgi:hypothetical protein
VRDPVLRPQHVDDREVQPRFGSLRREVQ